MFQSEEEIDVDNPYAVAIAVLGATVVHFEGEAGLAAAAAAVVAATYSAVVDDIAVLDGHSPAFGLRLLRRRVKVAAGRVREKAGLDTGQIEMTRVDRDTCFAYVAPLIEDSQCIDRDHHRLRSS